ncbi:MAG TPA: acetate/propionate family kinase [Gaiellaceae bacterium]|nr:acetate/propionate family kinase [Gaiellaceae bacterium]
MGSVLVVNAGSTSLKLRLVDESEQAREVPSLARVGGAELDAVAHRVVHGGPHLRHPVLIDDEIRREILALEPLAPLHNAPALRAIAEAKEAFPDLPHVAVFDTGFHETIPEEASVYAVPARWREEFGVRRYGFHGLSVEWSVEQTSAILGRDGLRIVVCHLGGGCSVTAVRDGRSVDTTMGFSPLEGVPMNTRSGSIDPGAMLYLLREKGFDVAALDHALNFDSGIEGLGGGSGGTRELETAAEAGDPSAELAFAVFEHRVAGAVAGMAAAAGGIDALVFTAGIGEGSARVRERVCLRLSFLGVELDLSANRRDVVDRDIAARDSSVRVLVIHAREELVAARAARRLLRETRKEP